jgi:uncharacterized membrane protein YobD (UPF0266 family)
MSLRINANTFATARYLELDSSGVTFCETAFFGGVRKFGFREIECILMSEDNVLSFQVKQEVFSIPTKPSKKKHKLVINTLVHEVRRANGLTA